MSPQDKKFSLYDLTPSELESFFVSIGEKPYRAKQVLDFLYRHPADSIDDFTSLSKNLRENLKKTIRLNPLNLRASVESEDGAIKHAYELESDSKKRLIIESVWMPSEPTDSGPYIDSKSDLSPRRNTLCISSQVGCAAGCTFCATGKMGLKSQLTTGEIVYQVVHCLNLYGNYPDTVLFMGMGEPMHNFTAVCASVEIMTNPDALGFSQSRIVVSTAGEIDKLAELHRRFPRVRLAISLTASTDELRNTLVPLNERFNLEHIQKFLKTVELSREDKVTIEYALLSGVNDTKEQTESLVGFLTPVKTKVKVNLIPYNMVSGLGFHTPGRDKVFSMQKILRDSGIMTFIRRNRGRGIASACGQLAGQI